MTIFFNTEKMIINENVEDFHLGNQYDCTFLVRQTHLLQNIRGEICTSILGGS